MPEDTNIIVLRHTTAENYIDTNGPLKIELIYGAATLMTRNIASGGAKVGREADTFTITPDGQEPEIYPIEPKGLLKITMPAILAR